VSTGNREARQLAGVIAAAWAPLAQRPGPEGRRVAGVLGSMRKIPAAYRARGFEHRSDLAAVPDQPYMCPDCDAHIGYRPWPGCDPALGYPCGCANGHRFYDAGLLLFRPADVPPLP
jgi:hypothetical protein